MATAHLSVTLLSFYFTPGSQSVNGVDLQAMCIDSVMTKYASHDSPRKNIPKHERTSAFMALYSTNALIILRTCAFSHQKNVASFLLRRGGVFLSQKKRRRQLIKYGM